MNRLRVFLNQSRQHHKGVRRRQPMPTSGLPLPRRHIHDGIQQEATAQLEQPARQVAPSLVVGIVRPVRRIDHRHADKNLDPDGKKRGPATMRMNRRRRAQQLFQQLPDRARIGASHRQHGQVQRHPAPDLDIGLLVRTEYAHLHAGPELVVRQRRQVGRPAAHPGSRRHVYDTIRQPFRQRRPAQSQKEAEQGGPMEHQVVRQQLLTGQADQ